jgi:hypothetical protein
MWNDQEDAAKLEPHLRRVQAAKHITDTYGIPCSPKTLAKYACVGGGPPFRLAGRFPLYPVSGLDAWARSKIGPLVRSTSELRRVTPPSKQTQHRVYPEPISAQQQQKERI